MQITINNYDELLSFIKRADVSPADAINVFEKTFNVVTIVFICAIKRTLDLDKDTVIQKIEGFINEGKEGKEPNKVILFN
jgi:hypothetical protein